METKTYCIELTDEEVKKLLKIIGIDYSEEVIAAFHLVDDVEYAVKTIIELESE